MLAVFDQGTPATCPRPFNLAAFVLRHAEARPDKIALSILSATASEDWNYRQLASAVKGTGSGLLSLGLNAGDLVLMRLGNSVEFPIAYLGAIAAGLVPVSTSSQLTEPEVAKIVEDLNPAAILHDPSVASVRHDLTVPLDRLIDMRTAPPCSYVMGDPDRLAYVVYTSGTSGKPQAVGHAHRAIWARQMMVEGWYDLGPDDRVLHAGAFNWTFTLGTGMMDPWTMGATALIPDVGTPPDALPALLARHHATLFAAAPGVYRKILQSVSLPKMPELRHGLVAGEKLSQALHQRWIAATGTELFEAFGMSECSTFISSCPKNPARGAALGHPQPGRRVAILGPDGPVTRGEEGTIAIHRDDPGLMLGYLNAPGEMQNRLQGEWFRTGDQGVMAIDGQISYLGRADDMMNAGGFRVSPLEVETVLSGHTGIDAVGVTEVEVKADTRVIVAFYTGPEKLDESSLRTYVSERLASYKQPRAYVHLTALPTGANGKLLRRALQAHFKANPQ